MAINIPSIIDLCKKVDSKYTLCITAAKRARQLVSKQSLPLIDADDLKPLKVAVEEINRSLITYNRPNSKDE